MMKRTASAILALCLVLLPVEAGAEEPITGRWGENLTWSYDQTTKTLTISGEGRMMGYALAGDSRADWFRECAASCVWEDENGEEDVLAQAGKAGEKT